MRMERTVREIAGDYAVLENESGGTTEVLACGEDGSISLLGGSDDLHAGQFVDRVGVRLGFGFPAAIGAKVACPEKEVVCIAGDGSYQMNIQEMTTASYYGINVKVLIMNNSVLGMVHQWQNLFYGQRYSATVLNDAVDFVKLAEAMGAEGVRVATQEEFKEAFANALKSGHPVVIDCQIDSDDKVWPMVAPGAPINEAFDEKDLEAKNVE